MNIDRHKVEQLYQEAGLDTRYVEDEPGVIYEPHSHEGVLLFTLKGSALIKLGEQEWTSTEVGTELVIEDGQIHQAQVGDDGWTYIFAATPEEMKRQGL